jgi:hypothetical protein
MWLAKKSTSKSFLFLSVNISLIAQSAFVPTTQARHLHDELGDCQAASRRILAPVRDRHGLDRDPHQSRHSARGCRLVGGRSLSAAGRPMWWPQPNPTLIKPNEVRIMSKLSRRALVASASSLPALAISTVSLAAPVGPRDREAVLARAEQMVDILRNRFVCVGWHEQFDTNRAASFLEAVRQEDYNAEPRDAAGEFVHAWIIDPGQSFDWLYLNNPAGLITGAAHRSLPTSPTATDEDPIFAAIEAHRKAFFECEQCKIDDDIDSLSDVENDVLCELLEVIPTIRRRGGVVSVFRRADRIVQQDGLEQVRHAC